MQSEKDDKLEQELELLDNIFRDLDVNKDGLLDVSEVMKAFQRLEMDITAEEAEALIKGMKSDGELNPIRVDEWRDYMIHHPSKEMSHLMSYWRHKTFVDLGEDTLVPDDFDASELYAGMWWRHLIAGGVAGVVSRTVTAPLDRLKVFLQVRGSEFTSIMQVFWHMRREGGWKSMWRGNGINVLKIAPETAIKFMSYEQAKKLIRGYDERELSIHERFASGSIAGAVSQTVIYPLEVLKTRFCLRTTGQYRGIGHATKAIYQKEGIRAFYRGYVPNLLGIIPYAGIDLAIYETLKKWYLRTHSHEENPGVLVLLACGAISSSCGQVASYPLALVRTRLQAQNHANKSDNMFTMFRKIIDKEGITGLYRGITPNFIKVIPAVGVSYVVYEKTRSALGATMS